MIRRLIRCFFLGGHVWILSDHPALSRSAMPLTCRRCGALARQRVTA